MDSYEKSLQTLEMPSVLALLAAQAVSVSSSMRQRASVEIFFISVSPPLCRAPAKESALPK